MTEHEHDDDGNCIVPTDVSGPIWRFSLWDMAGIAFTGIGGLFGVTGQALNLAARECAAMANWTRQNYDIAQAQARREVEVAAYEAHRQAVAADLREMLSEPTVES